MSPHTFPATTTDILFSRRSFLAQTSLCPRAIFVYSSPLLLGQTHGSAILKPRLSPSPWWHRGCPHRLGGVNSSLLRFATLTAHPTKTIAAAAMGALRGVLGVLAGAVCLCGLYRYVRSSGFACDVSIWLFGLIHSLIRALGHSSFQTASSAGSRYLDRVGHVAVGSDGN